MPGCFYFRKVPGGQERLCPAVLHGGESINVVTNIAESLGGKLDGTIPVHVNKLTGGTSIPATVTGTFTALIAISPCPGVNPLVRY